jgi:hypothetical protein
MAITALLLAPLFLGLIPIIAMLGVGACSVAAKKTAILIWPRRP